VVLQKIGLHGLQEERNVNPVLAHPVYGSVTLSHLCVHNAIVKLYITVNNNITSVDCVTDEETNYSKKRT
jgi:hypothetical protein